MSFSENRFPPIGSSPGACFPGTCSESTFRFGPTPHVLAVLVSPHVLARKPASGFRGHGLVADARQIVRVRAASWPRPFSQTESGRVRRQFLPPTFPPPQPNQNGRERRQARKDQLARCAGRFAIHIFSRL